MAKNLVIVESPAKAKTIEKYLGKDFTVKASVGHIMDLPPSKLGVDVEKDFKPTYVVIKGKQKVLDEITKNAEKADTVYLATDPDREGEAIAWHIAHEIKDLGKNKKKGLVVHRVLFNEITKKAVQLAIQQPVELNTHLFDAQQARRVLDRLVGYKISPILWEKVKRGLSAGRVQSVAVRIVCEREKEIEAFVPVEYWSLTANLEGSLPPAFLAKLAQINGEKAELGSEAVVKDIRAKVESSPFVLKEVVRRERKRMPYAPFVTSKLQQEAARKLGFTAKKTMTLAQKLYEGVELEGGELVGLITYMRTDSTRLSDDAVTQVREYISQKYGATFLPAQPWVYKSKKAAQDAHEAIRPTSIEFDPARVKEFLERDSFRLYELIWKRFVACQMSQAIYDQTTFNINAGPALFRATGSILKFAGFTQVYMEGHDEQDPVVEEDEESAQLPDLKEGETLKLLGLDGKQHFTQPPPRFTEASLVKELEEKGIGRPSTYASILSVIQDKKYAEKREGKFYPTQLGNIVNDLLTAHFPSILNVAFTAKMEEELDEVEEGKRSWTDTLRDFYQPFAETLEKAKVDMKDLKKQEIATDLVCEKCGKPMVVKWGRHGEFLACSGYPECKTTKEVQREGGAYKAAEEKTTTEVCEKCGAPMIFKRGRFGEFLACSKYPECKSTKAIPIGVNCPECGKALSERKTKRGKSFFGCTGYPNCKFALWDRPLPEPCPNGDSKFLLNKYSKKDGNRIVCPNKECGYTRNVETPAAAAEG
ncbi:MAG: type I DNA topoisomerase [Deltaproteobacteria bacterium]|nr:type I DNA topoisomerase [Deltaproteobacteria bacterium]